MAEHREVIPTNKARQGGWGRQVLMVLIAGLILAGIAWVGVELWGEQIDQPAADDAGGSSTDGN